MEECKPSHNPCQDLSVSHLAITFIPVQPWSQPYDLKKALKQGTIFPNLDLPFFAAAGGEAND